MKCRRCQVHVTVPGDGIEVTYIEHCGSGIARFVLCGECRTAFFGFLEGDDGRATSDLLGPDWPGFIAETREALGVVLVDAQAAVRTIVPDAVLSPSMQTEGVNQGCATLPALSAQDAPVPAPAVNYRYPYEIVFRKG